MNHRQSRVRTLLKTISWRIVGTLLATGIVWALTRTWKVALIFGGFEALIKSAAYYLHERAWDSVRFGKLGQRPAVIWLTGLSGAGKSTLSELLVSKLRGQGARVEHLDGDNIRKLFPAIGFSKTEREDHVKRVGLLAHYLERNGVFVVVSLISPYRDSRNFARNLCTNFIEVHVATPLEVCESRDPKGLYASARQGRTANLTGVDDAYEAPQNPAIRIDTTSQTEAESFAELWNQLEARIEVSRSNSILPFLNRGSFPLKLTEIAR